MPSKTVLTRYGGYFGKGLSTHRSDMTLATPTIPDLPDWFPDPFWADRYRALDRGGTGARRGEPAAARAIQKAWGCADRNQYNLEVLLALAQFIDHHWQMFLDLEQVRIR